MKEIQKELRKYANKEKVKVYQGFFKTGKGEYGEGDVFIGVTVPNTRIVARKFKNINLSQAKALLKSKIHEERLCALLILVEKFKENEKEVVDFYLKHTKYVNNWDLVDLSADKILGTYLLNKNKKIIYKLVKSKYLWERRISILTTFTFIKNNQYKDSLKIAEILLNDKHDLIHKAIGWMLREIGKRNLAEEERFLKKHYKKMPRTMLRYAIERFPERKRKAYLLGNV
ncbi:DNA alkylation repair protein [Nanoarchaeota archaeon]